MCLQKESEFKNSYLLTRVDKEGQAYLLQAWQNDPRSDKITFGGSNMSENFNIVVVLDRSGSMGSVKQATIDGFNEFINGQRVAEGNAEVTLIQFDDVIETVYSNIDVREVPALTSDTYLPRGMTALYDAVGAAITKAEGDALRGRGGKVLIVIITDGLENMSKTWNQNTVASKIRSRREVGWDFVFIGANQDAWAVGTKMGVAGGYTKTFDFTPAGTRKMFIGLSSSAASYRSANVAGQRVNSFFDQDAENQNVADDGHSNVSKSK